MRQAFGPAACDPLENPDDLSCGPLRPLDDVDSWRDLRESYWRAIWGPGYSLEYEQGLVANIETLRNAESISLWIGNEAAEPVDHRVLDGVKAAQFLGEIRRVLEDPDELARDAGAFGS